MTTNAEQWISRFAQKLGTVPPDEGEMGALLGLAGVAAHASERTAAPISCWLAARAGIGPSEALAIGERLADELGTDPA